jgi:hypothetical protein
LVICEGRAEPREGPAAEVGAAEAEVTGAAAWAGRGVANSGRRSSWSWLSLNWFGQRCEKQLRGDGVTSTYRGHLDFGNFAIVLFVIQTIAEDVSKRLETSLDPVRHRFLLGLR